MQPVRAGQGGIETRTRSMPCGAGNLGREKGGVYRGSRRMEFASGIARTNLGYMTSCPRLGAPSGLDACSASTAAAHGSRGWLPRVGTRPRKCNCTSRSMGICPFPVDARPLDDDVARRTDEARCAVADLRQVHRAVADRLTRLITCRHRETNVRVIRSSHRPCSSATRAGPHGRYRSS